MYANQKHLAITAFVAAVTLLLLIGRTHHSDAVQHFPSDEELFRRELSKSFLYYPRDVPRHIWQVWLSSPSKSDLELSFRPAEESWTIMNPGYSHEVLTDSTASSTLIDLYARHPQVLEAYNALPKPILKADFLRYLLLLARGGIYSDIDTTALKPATEWIPADLEPYGLVIGIEADPDRPDWQDWYARRLQFCQWTIMSVPGHPILVDIVASITRETLRREALGQLNDTSMKTVMEFTGPGVWTDLIFKHFGKREYFDDSVPEDSDLTWQHFANLRKPMKVGDVLVLPITSFSPGIGHMGAGSISDPLAYVQHEFSGKNGFRAFTSYADVLAGSWKDD